MKIDHFTINVSDLERSTRFYCEGLGFEHIEDHSYGNEAAGTALVQGEYLVHSRHLRGGGITLILNWAEVSAEPLADYRRQYGLTNFAVHVKQLESHVETLRRLGGTPVESSRAKFSLNSGGAREQSMAEVIVCLDPDGQPVELIAI